MVKDSRAGRPLLSIAIPVYNGMDTLSDALDSIVSQLSPGVEVVLSDNASTDGTPALIRDVAARHPSVILFENPENVGPMKNIELAVERATGEFVWLFGDDDRLRPGTIARVLEVIREEPGVGFISCNADMFGSRTQIVQENTMGISEDRRVSGVEETFVALHDHIGLIPTIIVRRSSWLEQARLDGRLDHWMHVRRVLGIAQHEDTYCLAEPRVMMDQSVVRWNQEGKFLTIIAEFCELVNELELSPELKKQRVSLWYRNLWTHIVVAKLHAWRFDRRLVARLMSIFGGHPRFWVFDLPLLLAPRFVLRALNALRPGAKAAIA